MLGSVSEIKQHDISKSLPTKSNEIRYSKRNQQFIFFPLQEKNQIFIHIEEKSNIERMAPRVTTINDTRFNNLSDLKQYKILKARKQAKKMSEVFQIKSINLIKKFNIEKQNKIQRQVFEKSFLFKNRRNQISIMKEKPKKIEIKKDCENLCITTTPFSRKKGFNSTYKEELMKDRFDFKLEILFKNLQSVSKSHGFQLRKTELQRKQLLKAYVGRGNNAGLVKELIKKRWWWMISDQKSDCKLIWSQLKDKNFYSSQSEILHNHFIHNEELGSKKALLTNLKKYYEKKNIDPFQYLPLTYHIINFEDENWKKFVQKFNDKKQEQRAWIIKPGENSNRGNGITIHDSLDEIEGLMKKIIQKKEKSQTVVIQEYIDKPFLYNKRKFDLRCYVLLVKLGKVIRCYWCRQGYIRTSCYEFKLGQYNNSYIHLTNDAIQINCEDYGKFEEGNKLSFNTFQKYLDSKYNFKYNFKKQIYPLLKEMASDSIKSSIESLGIKHPSSVFELFGLDFMIDHNFKPWLIEINTNPCIETSSHLQRKLLPRIIDDAFKLSIDVVFPPPQNWPNSKKHLIPSFSNCFELMYTYKEANEQIEREKKLENELYI